jgi:hypothetical protein
MCSFWIQSVLRSLKETFHSQLNVMNGGTDTPSASDFTNLPGMYTGYTLPNVYNDNLNEFVVAGPKVVSFADSDSSDPSPSSVSSSGVPSSGTPSSGVPSSRGPSPTLVSSSSVPPHSSGVPSSGVPSSGVPSSGVPSSHGPSPTFVSSSSVPPHPYNAFTATDPYSTRTGAKPTDTSSCKSKERPHNKRSAFARRVHRRNAQH